MYFTWRTALLRLAAMVGLAASAVLTVDTLHPGRAFCPLETACNAARESPLGSVLGIPTSSIGIAAFTGLVVLTLLPPLWARRLLRPAGVLAGVAGQAFVFYQAVFLDSFCPLCVVADAAAIFASVLILTWPPVHVWMTGDGVPGEPHGRRAAFVLLFMAVAIAPFAWPRDENPGWVELSDDAMAMAFEDEPVEEAADPVPDEPAPPPPVADETEAQPVELEEPKTAPAPPKPVVDRFL